MGRALWWLKRDVRLTDNPALTAALGAHERVVAAYFVEPALLRAPEHSAFHLRAVLASLEALERTLAKLGSTLLIVHEDAPDALALLHARYPFSDLYSHEETGGALTYSRDKRVARWCESAGVAWHEARQTGVFRALKDRDTRTQRWHALMNETPLPAPSDQRLVKTRPPRNVAAFVSTPASFELATYGFSVTAEQADALQQVSEPDAQATLGDFLTRRGLCYSGGISSPNKAFTCGSRLSVHLAYGTLSSRSVYHALNTRIGALKGSSDPDAGKWRRSLTSFRSRLHWRDHFVQRLETEPEMEVRALNPLFRALEYEDEPALLDAFMAGQTGFPLVDACMRCAAETGFLNFRMRAMITSVACHALHLSWQHIMYPTARLWADYEPGIHIAQLQMQAGVVGINTLRIYNPAKQIIDHDPDATFIKRWVPELSEVSPEMMIAHQDTPLFSLPHYPKPCVDWRARTLATRQRHTAIKRAEGARAVTEGVLEKHGSRKRPARRRRAA